MILCAVKKLLVDPFPPRSRPYFSQLPSRKMVVLRPTATHKFGGGEGDSLFLRTLSFLPKPIVMECLDCSFCILQTCGEGFLVPEGEREREEESVFLRQSVWGMSTKIQHGIRQ